MDFSQLDALKKEIAELSRYHVGSLATYFSASDDLCRLDTLTDDPATIKARDKLGFRHTLKPKVDSSFSRASTSTCILSLCESGRWNEYDAESPWEPLTSELINNLLFLPWCSSGLKVDNAFTTAFQIEAVAQLIKSSKLAPTAEQKKRIRKGCQELHTALKDGLIKIPDFPPSTYLTHLAYSAYRAGIDICFPNGDVPKTLEPGIIHDGVEQACWRELNKHLALTRCASRTADSYQMGYAALIVGGLERPVDLTPEQSSLIHLAIDVLFDSMGDDGTWPRSQPLFHYPSFGSAYCFEYELLSRLLRSERLQEHWLRHLATLVKAFRGLKSSAMPQQTDGSITAYLWSSGAKTWEPEAESWSTASAYQFLFHLDRVVAEAIRRAIFQYLGAPYTAPTAPKSDRKQFAPKFLDCPLDNSNLDITEDGVVDALFNHFVNPIARSAKQIELGKSLDRLVPMSAIFFGPPGTSKTELSKVIAEFLNWPRISIDPSHFMRKGMDQLQAEADQVFTMLASAERIVVLMDEIDELVRAREHSPEPLNRFLTTLMLPKLIAINRTRRIVFIVATNHLENFDIAIKRPGRFDLVLQVLPPKMEAKLANAHWRDLISNAERDFGPLSSQEDKLKNLTYDEFEVLLRKLAVAADPDVKRRILDLAHSRCTMIQPIVEKSTEETDSKTWEDLADKQKEKMSFPHVELPIQSKLFGSSKMDTLEAAAGRKEVGKSPGKQPARVIKPVAPVLLEDKPVN
jgi:hypothetical protein